MKPLYALPLFLSACAPQIACERVWLDPGTGLYAMLAAREKEGRP